MGMPVMKCNCTDIWCTRHLFWPRPWYKFLAALIMCPLTALALAVLAILMVAWGLAV